MTTTLVSLFLIDFGFFHNYFLCFAGETASDSHSYVLSTERHVKISVVCPKERLRFVRSAVASILSKTTHYGIQYNHKESKTKLHYLFKCNQDISEAQKSLTNSKLYGESTEFASKPHEYCMASTAEKNYHCHQKYYEGQRHRQRNRHSFQ